MNEIQFRYQIQISYLRSLPHPIWPQPAQARVTSTRQDERPASNTFLSHSCFNFLPAGSFDWYNYFLFRSTFISLYPVWNKKSIFRFIINFKNSNECWHLLWAVVIDCSGLGWIIQSMNDGSVRSSVSMLLINSPSLHVNLTPGMTAEGSPVS